MICFVQTFIKMLSVSAGSIFLLGLNGIVLCVPLAYLYQCVLKAVPLLLKGIVLCVPLAYQRNNTQKFYDFSL